MADETLAETGHTLTIETSSLLYVTRNNGIIPLDAGTLTSISSKQKQVEPIEFVRKSSRIKNPGFL